MKKKIVFVLKFGASHLIQQANDKTRSMDENVGRQNTTGRRMPPLRNSPIECMAIIHVYPCVVFYSKPLPTNGKIAPIMGLSEWINES